MFHIVIDFLAHLYNCSGMVVVCGKVSLGHLQHLVLVVIFVDGVVVIVVVSGG